MKLSERIRELQIQRDDIKQLKHKQRLDKYIKELESACNSKELDKAILANERDFYLFTACADDLLVYQQAAACLDIQLRFFRISTEADNFIRKMQVVLALW